MSNELPGVPRPGGAGQPVPPTSPAGSAPPLRQAAPVHTFGPTAPPPTAGPPWYTPQGPPRKGRGWVVILVLMLLSSLGANLMLAVMWGSSLVGRGGLYRTEVVQAGSAAETVAVVPIYDIIDDSAAGWIDRLLGDLADDVSVRAVVLRVDSPGGTVSASDQLNHRIRKFRQDTGKPVIVSQGGFATSGAYYVSVAADRIVAERSTWTGNIGVIMTTFVARRGLEDKLGISPVVITSSQTPFKDVPSLFRELKAEEQKYLEGLVESAYRQFVDAVVTGRPDLKDLAPEEIASLADGKVYTADQAQKNGLIDEIGYLADACALAGKQAGLTQPRVILYTPRLPGWMEILLGRGGPPPAAHIADHPTQAIEGLLAPRLLYLYHGQSSVTGWPRMRYPGQ